MGGNGISYRIHAGKERPARRDQRLVRFQYDREFHQIVAPHPNQRPGARLRRNIAAVREGVAEFTQGDQSITGRQVERRFQFRETRHRRSILMLLLRNCTLYAIPHKGATRAACKCLL